MLVWWVVAAYWLVASVLSYLAYPVLMSDTMARYAPMADAFARCDWFHAFHPRFGVLFPVLAGSIARLPGIDGSQSVQIAAFLMHALAAVPVWYVSRRLFGRAVAWWAMALFLVNADLCVYCMDGLRESAKSLGFALIALGVCDRRSALFGLGLFVIVTSFSYCFAVASVLLVAWCVYFAANREWRRIPLAVAGWLLGSAAATYMVHAYTGHWLPAPQFIGFLGGAI